MEGNKMTLDPHYDGGHRASMAEYYKGYDDGTNFKKTDFRFEKNVHPYKAGWDRGYEDKGKAMEEVVEKIMKIEL